MKDKKNVILISYDAFSEDNWEFAKKQSNLKKLIENGAYTNKLKSIYPTLTYVVHTTMVTGCYPSKHGIYHNTPFQPFVADENQEWFWDVKHIKEKTFYEVAYENKMKVGSLLWPVTAKAKINYNIPEVRAINGENQALKILKTGSPFFAIEMELKNSKLRKGIMQPHLDNYTNKCAVDTIKNKNVDLMMLHLVDLDDHKHNFGINSKEVKDTIVRMDKRIGELIEAVEISEKSNDTVFVVLGDHGQIDVKHKIKLNKILKDAGLIFEKDGKLDYRAYFQTTGGSAYLFVKENDFEAESLAVNLIKDFEGIENIFSKDELIEFKAPIVKNSNYMIEAKRGYSFDDGIDGDKIILNLEDLGKVYATHGYLPTKENYRCNLVISGNGIKNNFDMDNIEMVDIAPTISKILGFEFLCDGRILDEIFE